MYITIVNKKYNMAESLLLLKKIKITLLNNFSELKNNDYVVISYWQV
jgi:hypothetical protein